jgi:hypothetical protein
LTSWVQQNQPRIGTLMPAVLHGAAISMSSLLMQLEELLLHVLPGSSLSELTALESIIDSLVQQEKMEAHNLMRLLVHDICCHYQELRSRIMGQQRETDDCVQTATASKSYDNDDSGEAGREVAPVDSPDFDQPGATESKDQAAIRTGVALLRSCFSLLSMLTAAKPSVLDVRYIPVLLEVGFSTWLSVSAAQLPYLTGWSSCNACCILELCISCCPHESLVVCHIVWLLCINSMKSRVFCYSM